MSSPSRWDPPGSQPPNVGTTDGDQVVSFKTGDRPGESLNAPGDYSDNSDGFDANHTHNYPGGEATKGNPAESATVSDIEAKNDPGKPSE